MNFPIGETNFGKLVKSNAHFVDKSLFVREVLEDSAHVIVITRPRHFGKTFNLSLLHHFLSPEVDKIPTHDLFQELKISQYPDIMAQQGQYPVIHLTFKDVSGTSYTEAYRNIEGILAETYSNHRTLLEGGVLFPEERKVYEAILHKTACSVEVKNSLKALTEYLYRAYKVRPFILIDAYDTPLQQAYLHGYDELMAQLMLSLLNPALKDNHALEKAVLTDTLRVVKSDLSGALNNVCVYSLLSHRYAEYFGFTEEEVDSLCQQAGFTEADRQGIKDWYNGYKAHETVLYHPRSLMHCLSNKGHLATYWSSAMDHALIQQLLMESDPWTKERLKALLEGQSIQMFIDEHIGYPQLKGCSQFLWNFLLLAGYLKAEQAEMTERGWQAELSIPNKEVYGVCQQLMESSLK